MHSSGSAVLMRRKSLLNSVSLKCGHRKCGLIFYKGDGDGLCFRPKKFFCGKCPYFYGDVMKYTVKLNQNKDFVSLYNRGRFVAGKDCVVYFRKNGRKINRLGISTGKKIGNAVCRSRARRVIRQAYRENEELFPKGYDIVVTARAGAAVCKSYHISSFFRKKAIPEMGRSAKPAPKKAAAETK